MKRTAMTLALLAATVAGGCETAGELLVASTMSGDWKGTAYCAYGIPLEMVLTLDYLPGGATTATNTVTFKGNVGEAVLAAYTLRGTYDVETYKLAATGSLGWRHCRDNARGCHAADRDSARAVEPDHEG